MASAPSDLPALPERVDVVVVGGGIIGTSTAYFLARKGVSVLLCEKGRIAGEQSSRNWGFVRQQGRAVEEIPLIMESLRTWRGLDAEIGENTGFHQGGVLYVGDSDARMQYFADWLELAKQHQLDTRMLSAAELSARFPGLAGSWKGALHTPSDGRAEPSLAAPAIARAVTRLGGHVVTECAVRGLDLKAGRIAGVVTERGRVACGSVVLAGGAWSSLLCGNQGIDLPQLKIQNNVLRTTPAPDVTQGAIWAPGVAIRRRQDGGYTVAHGSASDFHVGPDALRWFYTFQRAWEMERADIRLRFGMRGLQELFTRRRWTLDDATPMETVRVLDPKPPANRIEEILANMRKAFPALGEVRVVESWAGMIDVTPDAIPVISAVDAIPGFFLSTGYSGHGFGIGPGAGRLTAELVTGAPTCVDASPFRFSRFSDGSAIGYGGAA
jgi:glycine/D-amino acid oxidase-like deaminating enzyme